MSNTEASYQIQLNNTSISSYVQYHNSDAQGSPPVCKFDHFSIYTSKSVRNLTHQRVWLISGQGKPSKKFFLEYVFTVSDTKSGDTNEASGTEGIRFNPPIPLNDLPWFQSFKKSQFFSLGLYRIDEETEHELAKLAENHTTASGLDRLDHLTADDYYRALNKLSFEFNDSQIEMLVGHANATNSCISTQTLARLAGFTSFSAANLHYGKLGRKFAEYFHVTDLTNQIQALATANHQDDDAGHFQWVMRPPLRNALLKKWPDLIFNSYAKNVADDEEFTDEESSLLPTQRATIVQARIGQGNYRRKLLDLWNGQCALTGCDVEEVLRASHAKPWKTSNNQERLDPYNGLLLAAHVDALFDAGLIGFSNTGKVLLSDKITPQQLKALGIETSQTLRFVNSQHHKYLAAHRKKHELK